MKISRVAFTIGSYLYVFGENNPLSSYLWAVSSRMSKRVKQVIDEEVEKIVEERNKNLPAKYKELPRELKYKRDYVSGEIALWDLLTSNGVDEILAAKLAANFPPDPIRFDPGIIRAKEHNLREKFDEKINEGKSALEVIVILSKESLEKSFAPNCEEKFKIFEEYVKSESSKYYSVK